MQGADIFHSPVETVEPGHAFRSPRQEGGPLDANVEPQRLRPLLDMPALGGAPI